MAQRGAPRIPRELRLLLSANLVSALGSGLTMPYLLIYLHEVRHLSLAVTGAVIGGAALATVPAGPATGALVDRYGPGAVCTVAAVVDGVATAGLAAVHTPAEALGVLLLGAIGQGATWPAWNALFALTVSDPSLRPRVYARSFQLLNLGLGIGAVVAGAVVRVGHPATFLVIYLVDGATFGVVALGLQVVQPRGRASGEEEPGRSHGGYRRVVADRRFLQFLGTSAFLALGGYSAISAGLVGYATVVVGVAPLVIAWAFGLNTALIVALQPLALRCCGAMRRTSALAAAGVAFASSWLVLAAAGRFPHSVTGDLLVISMFGVFALGEVLLAPVNGMMATLLAPAELVGRYSATSASVYSVTSVAGPPIAGSMIGAGLGTPYLLGLAGCGLVAAAGFRRLRHVLTPSIDNAPGHRGGEPAEGDGGPAPR